MVMFIVKENKELRDSNYIRIINKKIQTYISNGCEGYLDLYDLPITKLPSNLKYVSGVLDIEGTKISELPNDIVIEGDLWCYVTPLSIKYTKAEIKNKWKIYGKVYY